MKAHAGWAHDEKAGVGAAAGFGGADSEAWRDEAPVPSPTFPSPTPPATAFTAQPDEEGSGGRSSSFAMPQAGEEHTALV